MEHCKHALLILSLNLFSRYDRTLGGVDMQLRLRDHLIQRFNDLKKTTKDVSKDSRAIAKLFKEAGRLKNVLSANTDHYAQVKMYSLEFCTLYGFDTICI